MPSDSLTVLQIQARTTPSSAAMAATSAESMLRRRETELSRRWREGVDSRTTEAGAGNPGVRGEGEGGNA